MLQLAGTIVVVAATLLVFYRLEPLIMRALAVAEKRADIYKTEVTKPVGADDVPMPRDFVDWAMNESDEWAREAMLARMRELYGKLRDWEKVRIALVHEEEQNIRATFS